MSGKVKTVGLMLLVVFLLGTTLYVSYLLRSDSKSSPTTIRKTQAASSTYSNTVSFNRLPSPTATTIPTPSPTPTTAVIAQADTPNAAGISVSGTPTPTLALTLTPTPTTAVLALNDVTPSPTEVVLAQVTSTPTPAATASAKVKVLPETGWIKPAHLIFLFAFSLIFFSLIY